MRRNGVCIILLLGLVACDQATEGEQQLQVQLENIRQQTKYQQPDEPESVVPVPQFRYAADQLPSPILPPSLARELQPFAGRLVQPDFKRPKQYLEQFALERLLMKGSIQGRHGVQAIIETEHGRIELVKVGDYLGKHHGRIVHISPQKIELVELVASGQQHYVQRARTLHLLSVGQ